MSDIDFIDARGRLRSVADLHSRHVLLHCWASETPDSFRQLQELQAFQEQYPELPVTLIGFNMDGPSNAHEGRMTADMANVRWAQNYVGSESPVTRQLAPWSLPASYLIGPDGALMVSTNSVGDLLTALPHLLQERDAGPSAP